MEDLKKEIKKIKFQMKLVGEALSFDEHPIASLIISMDWDDKDLNRAHDIFEKYDKKLTNGEKPNWGAFEREFSDELGIGYQNLKLIVLAFHRNYQWTNVCKAYATEYNCMEFHEITRK